MDRFVTRLPAEHKAEDESTPNVPASKVKTRKHDKAYLASQLKAIPLSNNTIARCICAMSKDREEQINDRIRDNRFPLQMDEATDSNRDFTVNIHRIY